MRRLFWASAAVAIGALAGCGAGGGPSADAVLTVYVSVPMHGPSAEVGRAVAEGARRALAEAGAKAGGVRVRAVYLDAGTGGSRARWDAARVAENARRANEDSRSIAYLGDLSSRATLTSLPITNEAHMLQVSPTAAAPRLVAPFEGSDEVPEETQPTGDRTFGRIVPPRPAPPRDLGHEAMSVILDSIARAADPTDREDVVDAFFDTTDRESELGTYSIDELGEAQFAGSSR